MISFFPAPYPDEIFYSVLCRYHLRSGNDSGIQTNLELWDRKLGKGLLFPAGIGYLESKILKETGMDSAKFITENTIFPFLKPFIPQNRGETIYDAMKNGIGNSGNIVSVAGLAWTKYSNQKYLRYCEQCVYDDILIYGEAYLHRLHQLPNIYVCPKHKMPITETNILASSLPHEFYQPVAISNQETRLFTPDITEKLTALSSDAQWLLIYGNTLGYYEETNEIYDILLKTRGFHDWNGKTKNKKLGEAVADFYDKDFLDLFGAYSSGVCQWIVQLLQLRNTVSNPMYHLLLIRFLADSAEEFFTTKWEKPPEYLPFGIPPYPCRNKVCEYHLKDVIDQIDIIRANGEPRATFSCPNCGMTYRRKRNTPKEKQYSGQIDILDYGWKWHETLENLLYAKMSINKIAKTLQCDTRTVVKFGIKLGIFPSEQYPKHRPYVSKEKNTDKMAFSQQQTYYRQRWKSLVSAYPNAARNELRLIDSKCDQWLHIHDKKWFEQNSPQSRKSKVDWSKRDDEYLALIKFAVEQMKSNSNRPKQITISAVAHKTGIGGKLYERLASGGLPKTQSFLSENLETLEQWRTRKILWAVRTLHEQGQLNLKKVKKIVAISHPDLIKLQPFIVACIEQVRQ